MAYFEQTSQLLYAIVGSVPSFSLQQTLAFQQCIYYTYHNSVSLREKLP
jgi:hypothetical protein